MFFVLKILISASVIAFVSWLSGKRPVLAGFITALPLVTMLAMIFSYWQYRDMDKINQFAASILVAIPLSLTFFIPFVLNRWLKMNFALTYSLAIVCLALSYGVHRFLMKA